MFYKSNLHTEKYIYIKSDNSAIVVSLSQPFKITIHEETNLTFLFDGITKQQDIYEEITHAQFYSVLFEAIEHLKEFLPDKNKDIFEPHGSTDFTQDRDYDDENPDREWWSHRRGVV